MNFLFLYTIENLEHTSEDGTVIKVYISYWGESNINEHGYKLRYRENHIIDLDPPGDNFIELEDLTEEQVRLWVDPIIEHDAIQSRLSARLENKIQDLINIQSTTTSIPWNNI